MEILSNIAIIFISIFFEALPFLLLGCLISSVIERYISNEMMARLIPKNPVLGSVVGIIMGFFIPACDCAVIPVAKRLIKKKVPINVAISFMLSSPIINPVVIISCYYAFYNTNSSMFWGRLLLGVIIALIIGIIMGIIFNKKEVVREGDSECACHHHTDKHSFKNDFVFITKHTAYDFFDVVKYLMFGAFLASLIQVLLPTSLMTMFNENLAFSIITMMLFAYLISLCSTSDSFVGRSLLSSFSEGSILAYLIIGPMIDVKNTIVLLGNFKSKFVFSLITLIFIIVFIFCLLGAGLL